MRQPRPASIIAMIFYCQLCLCVLSLMLAFFNGSQAQCVHQAEGQMCTTSCSMNDLTRARKPFRFWTADMESFVKKIKIMLMIKWTKIELLMRMVVTGQSLSNNRSVMLPKRGGKRRA